MVAKTSILMTNYSVTWIVKVYGLCDFVLSKRKQQLGTKLFGTGCDNNFRLRGFITAVNMRSTDYWTVISETKTSAFWIGVKIIYRKESLYALALVPDDWQVFLTSNICWPWHITCLCCYIHVIGVGLLNQSAPEKHSQEKKPTNLSAPRAISPKLCLPCLIIIKSCWL